MTFEWKELNLINKKFIYTSLLENVQTGNKL